MQQLQGGDFFGETGSTINLDGITMTDTVYTHEKVDWHYHENAYFTFVLQGNVLETNKKETYRCVPGTLLYHNWHEPHCNYKPPGFTRGFHVEIERQWFAGNFLNNDLVQGSINVVNPNITLSMYKIYRAAKENPNHLELAVGSLLIEIFSKMHSNRLSRAGANPQWVSKIEEILHDRYDEKITLGFLSQYLGMHPVHICRDFSKYFDCSIGEYLRKLKIEKALSLMADRDLSLTQVAHQTGFTDQSHFIRVFREFTSISPSRHRKLIQC